MQNSAPISDPNRLLDNQLTTRELFEYVKSAYGRQINGNEFTYNTVNTWLRNRSVPLAYGGNKITAIEKSEQFNMSILTLTNFERSVLQDVKTIAKVSAPLPPTSRPRKQRTKLYYETLRKAGKLGTKKTLEASTLPDNYKALGIRGNQLAGVHRKSK